MAEERIQSILDELGLSIRVEESPHSSYNITEKVLRIRKDASLAELLHEVGHALDQNLDEEDATFVEICLWLLFKEHLGEEDRETATICFNEAIAAEIRAWCIARHRFFQLKLADKPQEHRKFIKIMGKNIGAILKSSRIGLKELCNLPAYKAGEALIQGESWQRVYQILQEPVIF